MAALKEAGAEDTEALVAANRELHSRLASQKVYCSSQKLLVVISQLDGKERAHFMKEALGIYTQAMAPFSWVLSPAML